MSELFGERIGVGHGIAEHHPATPCPTSRYGHPSSRMDEAVDCQCSKFACGCVLLATPAKLPVPAMLTIGPQELPVATK